MNTNLSEFPKHPRPDAPRSSTQPPTVYVYEKTTWQYKVMTRTVDEKPLGEEELNALGKDGWELVAAVSQPKAVQFYLKRIRP